MPRCAACVLLIAIAAAASRAERRGGAVPSEANATPSVSIPIAPLGFVAPSASLLMERVSGTTLNFVDSNHLLFTFHKAGLMKRSADAQPDDDDQLIHADILNIATGQVESSSDWRMHDRDRFLWTLGQGKFVVRERDALYQTDSSLALAPYARFPGKLLSVQLSPDHKVMVAVTEEPAAAPTPVGQSTNVSARGNVNAPGNVNEPGNAINEPERSGSTLPVLVRILNIETNMLIGQTRTLIVPRIPTIETGFLEMLSGKGDDWVVVLKGFDNRERKVAEIGSSCSPTVQFLNTSVIMIGTCDRANARLLTAVNVDGKTLWDRRTESRRIWPTYAYAEDGSRFALATLVLNHAVNASDPFDPNDILGQLVEVFETNGGESRLVAPASPILDSGQNFALSGDGRRFAILHKDAIEIYDLK